MYIALSKHINRKVYKNFRYHQIMNHNTSKNKIKKYWINSARYDWYEARKKKNIFEVPWNYNIYNSEFIRSCITNRKNQNDEPVNVTYNTKMLRKLFRRFKCIKIRPFLFLVLYGLFNKKV